ncbi:hypothetical protein PRZ48_012037 [Zasmidium cellare]|uniref:Uncharacterized protein n=1 Tax=Zasmidium cellare TaxID=395010 RepID=A0ABR0E8P0_ZASCE|nr:hypothetical protein PRZ48_012037 [Zasmidium cellare]
MEAMSQWNALNHSPPSEFDEIQYLEQETESMISKLQRQGNLPVSRLHEQIDFSKQKFDGLQEDLQEATGKAKGTLRLEEKVKSLESQVNAHAGVMSSAPPPDIKSSPIPAKSAISSLVGEGISSHRFRSPAELTQELERRKRTADIPTPNNRLTKTARARPFPASSESESTIAHFPEHHAHEENRRSDPHTEHPREAQDTVTWDPPFDFKILAKDSGDDMSSEIRLVQLSKELKDQLVVVKARCLAEWPRGHKNMKAFDLGQIVGWMHCYRKLILDSSG